MKTIITLSVLLLSVCYTSAQRTDIALQVTQVSPIGNETRTFYCSADVRGTYGLDTALDETEIPTITPPAGIFYLWTVVNAPDLIWLSPLDIRKLRSEKYVEEYHLHAEWQGTALRFALMAGLPQYVDSIYLVDDYIEWPNSIYKQKLESGQQYEVTNQSLYNYVLRVYYDGTTVGVDDDPTAGGSSPDTRPGSYKSGQSATNIRVAPNPAYGDFIDVSDLSSDALTLDVIDVRGVTCATFDIQALATQSAFSSEGGSVKGLAIAHLPYGAYVLAERRSNGSIRHCMFLRQ